MPQAGTPDDAGDGRGDGIGPRAGGGGGREGVLRLLGWGVHLLTASGAVVGTLALLAAARGEFRAAALWMIAALAIDGGDGSLARALRVSRRAPRIDGRRLDDIVDYLNYVIVPAVFLVLAGAVPGWGFVVAPVLASAYGFSQVAAKTDDHFFLGFPSYWNVVAIYLWAFGLDPGAGGALVTLLAVAVFVPIKYVYPSQMTTLGWTTSIGAVVWTVVVAAAIGWPQATGGLPLLELSLLYPAWYLGLSFWLGGLHRAA